ncbi:MAG: hypothetical protein EBR82_04290 [Caulobacteraceae bacterium]|nr:hypothetical protein [Caulobacteraceae bacterium]
MEGRVSEHPLARYGRIMGVCALAGAVAGAASAIVGLTTPGGWLSATLVAIVVAIAMAVGLQATLKWWRGLDEAAQEAHKWAWWWGSTVGLAVAGVLFLTLLYGTGPQGDASVKAGLMIGAAVVIGCQVVGYAVAWAFWWLKRR